MVRVLLASLLALAVAATGLAQVTVQEYPVPAGSHPHDVAPSTDGRVWYTGQHVGQLGWLDPATAQTGVVALGPGSRPHGVIVGPDGHAWVTDSGLNALVRVHATTNEPTIFRLPAGSSSANLNTAVFDAAGTLWFTGQNGIYGQLQPASGSVRVFASPRGRGPYGIATTPAGQVFYVSLAGSFLGHVNLIDGATTVLEPPTARQGARRVWSDSRGVLWITGWNSGDLIRYDPASDQWSEIPLPGRQARPYAVYVDERDRVWISDFATNAILLYDPVAGTFQAFVLPSRNAQVRQLLGRPGEVWGAESATDKLVVLRY